MYRYTLTLVFICILVMLGYGKEITVCKSGCETDSIQYAIDVSMPGDKIIVKKGIYKEKILLDKPVSLIGEDYPIIDEELKYQNITVKNVYGFKIEGFDIRNSGMSYVEDIAGLKIEESGNCEISKNKFYNNFFALHLASVYNCKLIGNRIIGQAKSEGSSGNAIHIWNSKNIYVFNNYVKGHRDGIYFEFVLDSKIENNISEKNLRYGLHFMFSDNDIYINNTFKNNGAGVAVMYSKNIKMYKNKYIYNRGPANYGLLLKEIVNSELKENLFYKNTIGVYMEDSNRSYFEKNTFKENGSAVRILANCENNIFKRNNFINNIFDITTNSRQNYGNILSENYWSNYEGFDLNKDGFGDLPYKPVTLSSYLFEKYPPLFILLKSFFMYLLDLSERVVPTLTPTTLSDDKPSLKVIK
ncbi:MAG: nitrous oxide reductase family maturation protein NosD [Sulfurihydrogenibium azorense]|uniref:nitrous oxide reductase family maturation protein NosD n=1 Tax=Sulfurihydrogenibium azorense TaxID=309806 RepID=UPI00391D3A0D